MKVVPQKVHNCIPTLPGNQSISKFKKREVKIGPNPLPTETTPKKYSQYSFDLRNTKVLVIQMAATV